MTVPSRPRLVDIAARLNVSPSTVSRALAGSTAISEATRAKVVAIATEIGYTVNPVAAGLKRGHTLNIGLVAPMSYWYAGGITSGADRLAAERGYDFVVMNAAGGTDHELLIARARRLGRRVDGALIVDIDEGPVMADLTTALGKPAVTLGCEAPGYSSLVVDNVEIGAIAARHLTNLGHEQALVLSLENPSSFAFDNASIREQAFVAAFTGSTSTCWLPHNDASARRRRILDHSGEVTAIFCTSDELAIEAMAHLRAHGRAVPADVSVVGVDDHPLAAPLGLTTIAQEPEAMGAAATALLLDQLAGEDTAPRQVIGEIALVARTSTGPAPR